MIRKQTWIMLVIFAVALAAVVLMEKEPAILGAGAMPTAGSTSQPMLVEGWQSSDIAWIELKDSQGSSLRVIQDGSGKWVLDTEDGEPVDAGVVEEVRTQISAARTMAYLDQGYDLEAIGLNSATKVLTIRSLDGRETVIWIGQATPTGSGYYVRVDNAAPAVVSKYSIDDILARLQRDQLISLETFPASPSQP